VKSDLSTLVELQKTDSRIRELQEAIDSAEERRAVIEQEFEEHASSIREIQTRKKEAEERKATFAASIAEANTSLERANRNLTTAADQKQYEAAMREIDSLNKQVSKSETQILEQLEIISEAESVLEERAEEVNNLESDWEQRQADFETELKKNKREFNKLTKERVEVFNSVAPALATKYDRFIQRSRDGIAVAEVVDGACSACFMSLRKQMIVLLRTTPDILTCESCTRILYIDEEAQSEASA
jgi:predicted  nucleic acid-binding Zn-ribbon protein